MVLTEVVHFFESIGTRDVTIRKCTFENCNYGAAMGPAALCAMAWLKDFAYPAKPGVHKNVRLEGNTINGSANSGIFAAGIDGIAIKGNRLENTCTDATGNNGAAIFVMSSRGVLIDGNGIDPAKQGAGFKKSVGFGEGVEKQPRIR
jgi:parallel beta-helix repeat protein